MISREKKKHGIDLLEARLSNCRARSNNVAEYKDQGREKCKSSSNRKNGGAGNLGCTVPERVARTDS